jgi:hypothetical protein
MDHDDFKRHIRSRGDLGPDQKNILIDEDLRRRKGGGSIYEPPEEPTRDEFEALDSFTYNGDDYIVGKFEGEFWTVKSGSETSDVWFGPKKSSEEAIENTKHMVDFTEDVFDDFMSNDIVDSSASAKGTMYHIRKNERGFWGEYYPNGESSESTSLFDTLEKAKSKTLEEIKKYE